MSILTHLNQQSEAEMVDVSAKTVTTRTAMVTGCLSLSDACKETFTVAALAEICSVARTAGILAAKKTSTLIPHCHLVALEQVVLSINFNASARVFNLEAKVVASGKTGVEMEAFVGVQTAALTVYDMVKAVDPAAVVGPFVLQQKLGGKTGSWQRDSKA